MNLNEIWYDVLRNFGNDALVITYSLIFIVRVKSMDIFRKFGIFQHSVNNMDRKMRIYY